MTRFGEISALWQSFTNLWKIFEGLFLIQQNLEPTLANFLHYWAHFHFCKWENIEKIWSHWPKPSSDEISFAHFVAYSLCVSFITFTYQSSQSQMSMKPKLSLRKFYYFDLAYVKSTFPKRLKRSWVRILAPNTFLLYIVLKIVMFENLST